MCTAQVLKRWEETGATDADSLTKMLRRRSLGTVITIIVQAVLDAGASYGAFSLAGFLAAAENIPLHWLLSFGANFLGSYFAERSYPGLLGRPQHWVSIHP